MAATGAHWDVSPANFGIGVHALVREKTRKTAIAIFEYCVKYSPVDSGAYRASWTISDYQNDYFVGRQKPGVVLPPPPTPQHLSTKFYRTFYVSNGAPYALLIEEGHSDQAPSGVVRQAIKLASSWT